MNETALKMARISHILDEAAAAAYASGATLFGASLLEGADAAMNKAMETYQPEGNR